MADGSITFAEGLGSKALDSNEMRRQQKNARYSPPISTHIPFDLCPSPSTERTSPSRKLQQVFEEELLKEVAGQQQQLNSGNPRFSLDLEFPCLSKDENKRDFNGALNTSKSAFDSPQADVLVDSEVEVENVVVGIVSSTHPTSSVPQLGRVSSGMFDPIQEEGSDSEEVLMEVLQGVVSSTLEADSLLQQPRPAVTSAGPVTVPDPANVPVTATSGVVACSAPDHLTPTPPDIQHIKSKGTLVGKSVLLLRAVLLLLYVKNTLHAIFGSDSEPDLHGVMVHFLLHLHLTGSVVH
ncbi:hypothetical protein RHGRI_034092 [Rhododendron griersonianum]|uniref:Uncharacterized protein n=1 Tax=Rhododendron griersonianum TaxID=479676 RepID=A0AAV6HZ98_9ERIC|nr:hypothetical protein RHGRI_034092 [Rhododendron griersonianum]